MNPKISFPRRLPSAATLTLSLLVLTSLTTACSSFGKMRESKGVEFAAGNSSASDSNEAISTSGAQASQLPTQQSATDSQSAMSQSATEDSSAEMGASTEQEIASQDYQIPPTKNPEGEMRVTALGITDLKIRGDDRNRVTALHLQLEAKNSRSRTDWNLDSRLQQIRFSGSSEQIRPLFVQANSQSLPFIRIPSGATEVIDLFYAIPKNISAENAPSFELNWTMLASDESITQTTIFKRLYPESRRTGLLPFEQEEEAEPVKRDPAMKGTPMMREWWQDPYGYATPGSPVFNSYQ